MTAPLLNLPIFASAAPGGGQPAAAGGGATGFEALMAAFFATGEAEAGVLGEGEVTEEGMADDAADALLAPDAAALPAVDTQTMAALLAVTPQPQATTTDTESLPVAGGAPPAAFSPLLAQEIPAAVTPEAEATTAETPDTLLAPPVAEDGQAEGEAKLAPPGLEKPREPQVTAAADHAKPQGAPPAHAAAAAALAAPPPAPPTAAQSAADPLVQAEAAASQVELPAEPTDEGEPVRPGKSETGRRNVAAQGQTQAPAAAPVDPVADVVAPVQAAAVNTEASSEPNLAIEGKAAATTAPRDAAEPEAPDAQGHGSTTAGAQQAAGPIGEAPLPVRGSPETVAQLAAQIIKKLEGRSTHFDVELNPAGLGKVNVSIEIGAQGKMTAAMSFDTPQAAAELRGRSGELQKVLEQAGFDLSGGGLSFDVAGDRGQGRGDLNQQQQQQQDAVWRGRAFQAVLETADGAAEAAATAALYLQRRSTTGVDVRV